MDNSRLGQEHSTPRSTRSRLPGKNWKWAKDREEELRSISPLFHKLEGQQAHEPDPQEWKSLSQKLAGELEGYKAPLLRTVKDRLTASDGSLLQWFWILVALVLLAAIAAAVMVSLGAADLSFETAAYHPAAHNHGAIATELQAFPPDSAVI